MAMFELGTVYSACEGSALGVLGPMAVLDIVVHVPDQFDQDTMDADLDRVLGFVSQINTTDLGLQLLHRGIGLACFVQGMNRVVVSNQYQVLSREELESGAVCFRVAVSVTNTDATATAFKFANDIIDLYSKPAPHDIEPLVAWASSRLDRYGSPGQNQGFLLTLCMKRAMPVNQIWPGTHMVGTGRYSQRISSTMTQRTSAQAVLYAKNKITTAELLNLAGLPGSEHKKVATWEQTVKAAEEYGYPVVIKPYDRDNGQGVYAGITTETDLQQAYTEVTKIVPEFLVERHFEGVGHRITIVDQIIITVTKKLPAAITGDGVSTVQQLINAQQGPSRFIKRPASGEPFILIGSAVPAMTVDDEVMGMLTQQSHTLHTVPARDKKLLLRRRNNASAGGVTHAIDKTTVHPDNQELCLRAARIMDLDIAGIDLLIPDITQSWLKTGALICEVNAVPQVGYNHGITQIVDHIFQSGVRVPMHMVIVESWNTSDLHLAHELAAITGSNAFSASTGIWINGKCMSRPFDNGFVAARAVIFDQQVESAVCIMTKAEVAELGLPLDQFDQILIENLDDVVNWVAPHSTNIKPLKVYRNE